MQPWAPISVALICISTAAALGPLPNNLPRPELSSDLRICSLAFVQ